MASESQPSAQISDDERAVGGRLAGVEKGRGITTKSQRGRASDRAPAALSHKDASERQRFAASETLARSESVAKMFWASYPTIARGKSPELPGAPTIHYYFAKLYQLITYYELQDSRAHSYPGFTYLLINVFYQMYDDAVPQLLTTGKPARTTPLWQRYLQKCELHESGALIAPNGIMDVIYAAAQAHILGDLGEALARTYNSYSRAYAPKLFFHEFKNDFFGNIQKATFKRVTADFQSHMVAIVPIWLPVEQGQLMLWLAQEVAGFLQGSELWQWRQRAWRDAEVMLDQKIE